MFDICAIANVGWGGDVSGSQPFRPPLGLERCGGVGWEGKVGDSEV